VQSFSTGDFAVSFGDLDVCNATGEIFVVSSIQNTVAIFAPTGERTGTYGLPADVATPSGLSLTSEGNAYLSSTSGSVFQVSGLPCAN
jgi:sugar lactone lactonase YvrE